MSRCSRLDFVSLERETGTGSVPEGFPPAARPGVSSHTPASPHTLQLGNPSLAQLQCIARDVSPYFSVMLFDVRWSARSRGMLGTGIWVLLIMVRNEIC